MTGAAAMNIEPHRAAKRHYMLACSLCAKQIPDDGAVLDCPEAHEPALLQARYHDQRFSSDPNIDGLFRYRNWLPVGRIPHSTGHTVVYRSQRLARQLALTDLWIAFNGYWPERRAASETMTFKDLEAYTVLGRLPADKGMTLIVASSGNTGAAFARACSGDSFPCLLVVPSRALDRFRFPEPLHPCVRLAAIDNGNYSDAIAFTEKLPKIASFQPEGGIRNVARRAGLGTVMFAAVEELQRLPDYYFQAVGSGTGCVAVHEAAKQLSANSDEGVVLPRLMMCQNAPFTTIYDSWQLRQRSPTLRPVSELRQASTETYADELTNMSPPYAIHGGVYDVLRESAGDVVVTDNVSVRAAMDMFCELEGIDIEPASGVAVAGLRKAVLEGRIPKDACVLLNITGGGRARAARDNISVAAAPHLVLARESLNSTRSIDQVLRLF
jgi:cysteate synthase